MAEKTYRAAVVVLLVLVLANAVAAGLRTVSDFDMGWHLATGRWVVQHHAIPSTDVLSYTAAGTTWIYPPFAGVLLYLVYLAGGYAGLSVLCALACVATVAYLVRRRDVASLALVLCAVEPIAFRTGPRADLFNTVFLALMLGELWAYQRGTGRRLWLLPPIMLLWVNLHPGFVVGLAAIVAYLGLELFELPFAQRRKEALRRLRHAWPWLLASVAATLANPWGVKLYSVAMTLGGLRPQAQGTYSTAAFIQEFRPVPVGWHLVRELIDFRHAENGLAWLLLIALVVILVALRRKQPGAAAIQAAALYIGLQHSRYLGLFCVTTVVIGAGILGEAFTVWKAPSEPAPSGGGKRAWLAVPAPAATAFVVLLCAVALLHTADFVTNRTHVVFGTQSRFGAGIASWYPVKAADFIRREQLPGNVYEEFALGGFAAWSLGPEYPDFIDGRFDHLAPEVLVQAQKLQGAPPDSEQWRAAADRWGINVLLILESQGRAMRRQDALGWCQSTAWRPVYMDETALVLLRNTEKNRPLLERLHVDCSSQPLTPPPASASRKDRYDFWVNASGLLFALQRDQEAEAGLKRAAQLYPYDPNVRLLLAQLYLRHRMLDKAEAEYRQALQRRESDAAWFGVGSISVMRGRLPEAATAFSRAAHIAVSPLTAYMALAQVELLQRHPKAALRALDGAERSSPYRHGAEAMAPRLYADIADARADANGMLSRLPEAIALEEESLRLSPGVAERWNKLASMLEASGQWERARQARQRALELSPAPPSAPANH